MNQLSLQKICTLATLARQNRNNIALNYHVPDMNQWNKVYVPCSHRREVIFFARSLQYHEKEKCRGVACPPNGIEIALNTIVPAPTCNNETNFI